MPNALASLTISPMGDLGFEGAYNAELGAEWQALRGSDH